MSTAGVLDFQVVTGAVTGDVLEEFVQCLILPHLMPFSGTNQHSIVVMDIMLQSIMLMALQS